MIEKARIDFNRREISELKRLVHLFRVSVDGLASLIPYAPNSLLVKAFEEASTRCQCCAEVISHHVLTEVEVCDSVEAHVILLQRAWSRSRELASQQQFRESVEAARICETILYQECDRALPSSNSHLSTVLRGHVELLRASWCLIRNLADFQSKVPMTFEKLQANS